MERNALHDYTGTTRAGGEIRMAIYTCKDGTEIELTLSECGTRYLVAEGTSDADKAKFWETYKAVEKDISAKERDQQCQP